MPAANLAELRRASRLNRRTASVVRALRKLVETPRDVSPALLERAHLIDVATCLYGRPDTEDDASASAALAFIADLLARATDDGPERMSTREKRAALWDIVKRLELMLGVALSRETADLARTQVVELNTVGDRSIVLPEEVPEALREATYAYWERKHGQWAAQERYVFPGEPVDTTDGLASAEFRARALVGDARADGAFIATYDEMPAGQQLFWRQRAVGIEHTLT